MVGRWLLVVIFIKYEYISIGRLLGAVSVAYGTFFVPTNREVVFMKKEDIEKIDSIKKKIQKNKLEFEKMQAGQISVNKPLFDFWKPDIENVFSEIDVIMSAFILQVERTYILDEEKWFSATDCDCVYYVEEDIKDGRKRVNKALRKIKKYFDECKL